MDEIDQLERTVLDGLNAYQASSQIDLTLGIAAEFERLMRAAEQRIEARVALRRLIELLKGN